jgi:hypothetical protein
MWILFLRIIIEDFKNWRIGLEAPLEKPLNKFWSVKTRTRSSFKMEEPHNNGEIPPKKLGCF